MTVRIALNIILGDFPTKDFAREGFALVPLSKAAAVHVGKAAAEFLCFAPTLGHGGNDGTIIREIEDTLGRQHRGCAQLVEVQNSGSMRFGKASLEVGSSCNGSNANH